MPPSEFIECHSPQVIRSLAVGGRMAPVLLKRLVSKSFPQEEIMRQLDSALIKLLALIGLILLVSVAQAIIQGH